MNTHFSLTRIGEVSEENGGNEICYIDVRGRGTAWKIEGYVITRITAPRGTSMIERDRGTVLSLSEEDRSKRYNAKQIGRS